MGAMVLAIEMAGVEGGPEASIPPGEPISGFNSLIS
jgi:hypothetical protein